MDILSFYKYNKVDPEFDEIYYSEAHPETKDFYQPYCSSNNINNKHRLYYHYVFHGRGHGFNIKRFENKDIIYSSMKNDTQFILYSTFYNSERRQKELDYCLSKNLNNNCFDKVYIFTNKNTIIPSHLINHEKLEIISIENKTPTYSDWTLHSKLNNYQSDFITIFSNADIYFDDTIIELKSFLNDDNGFACISRYEFNTIKQEYELCSTPKWSQDVWALNNKSLENIDFDAYISIPTGKPRCDNKIAYKFAYQGYDLYNPCYHIKTYHKHESNYRDYDDKKDALLGAACFVEPCEHPNSPSYKQYIIGTKNVNDTNKSVVVSDYLSPAKVRNFNIICSDKNIRHLYGGWGSINDKLERIWKKDIRFNLITFLWEAYQSFGKDIASSNWVGIEHLVNYCPEYYEDIIGKMPTISNFYTTLWNLGIIENNCQGILFTSRYTQESNMNMPYLKNIKTDVAYHPILVDNHCKKFSMENFINNEHKRIINLGWFNRNFAFFERLNIEGFEKYFVFGGKDDYKYKIFLSDMKHNGVDDINTEIADKLIDEELNNLLSNNIIFVNLYDSSANNAIINAIQRYCPILVNKLPACEEYLGSEYPLFYESQEEIHDLLSEDKLEEAHQYLKNLDIQKFSIDNILYTINNFKI